MKDLSPDNFHKARVSLGLSIAKVAKETGINRNYLSNFEKNKQFLDDKTKAKLRDHYELMDKDIFNFEEPEDIDTGAEDIDQSEPDFDPEKSPKAKTKKQSIQSKKDAVNLLSSLGYRLVDGKYIAPSSIDEDTIENEAEAIEDINEQLSSLLDEQLPVGGFIFSGVNREKSLSKGVQALALMAKKQLHHEKLQGESPLEPIIVEGGTVFDFKEKELSELKVKDLVQRMLHGDNKLSDEA